MCLAVPGRVLSTAGDDALTRTGRIDFGGVIKEVNLIYVPESEPGDYVIVHVGFAIAVMAGFLLTGDLCARLDPAAQQRAIARVRER